MKAAATDRTPDDTDAIYAVVARCVGVPGKQLTANTSLVEDLGFDSIDLLALAVDLEAEFDVVVTDQALSRIRTIGDAIRCMVGACELRLIERGAASVQDN